MKISRKHLKSIERLKKLVIENRSKIIMSSQLSREDKEILIYLKWIKEIIKGWYLVLNPYENNKKSTIWYAHFWEFLAVYLHQRFGEGYCLSPESSLDFLINDTTIPKQVIVVTKKRVGGVINLSYDTSILIYSNEKFSFEQHVKHGKLQVMPIAVAICRVSPTFFNKNQIEAEIALKTIKNASEVSKILIKDDLVTSGGRLVGAFRFFLKNDIIADNLERELRLYWHKLKIVNPFEAKNPIITCNDSDSIYSQRIFAMWERFRGDVINNSLPKPKKNKEDLLNNINEIYSQDAYNSLSIEGFDVTDKLIKNSEKRIFSTEKNALAARGYYLAFQEVKKSIKKMVSGDSFGEIFEKDHQNWYVQLFLPSVEAGIVLKRDLLGYRSNQVYIRNSRHIPPRKEVLIDSMSALFLCLKKEKNPLVRAILGHYIFVYIHPYSDGNGRIGRLLMNSMMISDGYNWTIVHMENREKYLDSLEQVTVEKDILPFVKFIENEMKN